MQPAGVPACVWCVGKSYPEEAGRGPITRTAACQPPGQRPASRRMQPYSSHIERTAGAAVAWIHPIPACQSLSDM